MEFNRSENQKCEIFTNKTDNYKDIAQLTLFPTSETYFWKTCTYNI